MKFMSMMLLSLMLALGLSACGSSDDSESNNNSGGGGSEESSGEEGGGGEAVEVSASFTIEITTEGEGEEASTTLTITEINPENAETQQMEECSLEEEVAGLTPEAGAMPVMLNAETGDISISNADEEEVLAGMADDDMTDQVMGMYKASEEMMFEIGEDTLTLTKTCGEAAEEMEEE